MHIATGVATIELEVRLGKNPLIVHPTLLWDSESVVLVDTGTPGQLPAIRKGMADAGVAFGQLRMIILTHQDLDHIGSLPELIDAVDPVPEVVAHELAKPYIEGARPLLKMDPDRVGAMLASLPQEQRRGMEAVLRAPPRARVDRVVVDGDELDVCGGITIVATPGHTPDHMSLYHRRSKTLIAGDALTVEAGELYGPRPGVTHAMDTAIASLAKLTTLAVEAVICFHGGVFLGNANERIKELAAS
jgi:glyoxylase-like metal-dependent hydrolase (beta-lactamase superfamily II)